MNALRKFGYVVQFACFVHLFNQHVGEVTFCLGPSMLPTFNTVGDVVALEHISTKLKRLSIGDVIVCISPVNPSRAVCKRILGMPGDEVIIDPTVSNERTIKVPPGHLWLVGDNMSNSTDSRSYGPVPYALVRGRVFARIWPAPCLVASNISPISQ